MRGQLITLEGIDGTGKSTIAEILEKEISLVLPHSRAVMTAEPTKGSAGMLLRKKMSAESTSTSPFEYLFLFMADHAAHLKEIVAPATMQGEVVISDRYSDSRAAYQGAMLKGLHDDPVNWILDLHGKWSIAPDLTILFVIDPMIAVDRCSRRLESGKRKEKFEMAEFLGAVQENYLSIAKKHSERFVIIDANQGIRDVAALAKDAILRHLRSADFLLDDP